MIKEKIGWLICRFLIIIEHKYLEDTRFSLKVVHWCSNVIDFVWDEVFMFVMYKILMQNFQITTHV